MCVQEEFITAVRQNCLSESDISDFDLKEIFIIVDCNHSGGIDADELIQFLTLSLAETVMSKQAFSMSMFELAEFWVSQLGRGQSLVCGSKSRCLVLVPVLSRRVIYMCTAMYYCGSVSVAQYLTSCAIQDIVHSSGCDCVLTGEGARYASHRRTPDIDHSHPPCVRLVLRR